MLFSMNKRFDLLLSLMDGIVLVWYEGCKSKICMGVSRHQKPRFNL